MDVKIKAEVDSSASSQEIFQAILVSRGYKTEIEQKLFLHPPEPTLKYLLKEADISKSVLDNAQKLLDSHLKADHDVCVFGDYDADGVSATAIMWQAVTAYAKKTKSNSRILPFIPDRHKHGYGLGVSAVSEVISGEAFGGSKHSSFIPNLVLTVDTGIVAHHGIDTFRGAGIDVIVSDHHLPDDGNPVNANCLIHTTTTSGAGVAWIFALHLLGESAMKLLDLATIGVVGDMMPLTGINRAICASGLRSLSTTMRPGIVEMKRGMGKLEKELTTYDVSFGIAPRINAAGRIYSPMDALRLLCTGDPKLAAELAAKIESHNQDRQQYTDDALKSAAQILLNHKIIVLIGGYHEGVIGLVAGKLAEMYHRPAIVMSNNGEVIKGSARSVNGVNITGLLRSLKTPFLGIGGHDQAAGFSLSIDQVDNMQKEVEVLADSTIADELLVKSYSADLSIDLDQTTMDLAQMIATLEPFGMGNPKPKFLLKDLIVTEDRMLGSEGKHRKLTVEQDGITRELMLFNTKEPYPLQKVKSAIVTLDINMWRDKQSLQLIASYVET